jgi:hypothetical protein
MRFFLPLETLPDDLQKEFDGGLGRELIRAIAQINDRLIVTTIHKFIFSTPIAKKGNSKQMQRDTVTETYMLGTDAFIPGMCEWRQRDKT